MRMVTMPNGSENVPRLCVGGRIREHPTGSAKEGEPDDGFGFAPVFDAGSPVPDRRLYRSLRVRSPGEGPDSS